MEVAVGRCIACDELIVEPDDDLAWVDGDLYHLRCRRAELAASARREAELRLRTATRRVS